MYSNLKKIELHLHLDGSVRKETIEEYLNREVEVHAKKKCTDLNDYLKMFEVPISIMQTKESLIRISRELVEDLIKDNIIYAEIRFAPIYHTKKGLTLDEIVESVLIGLKNENIKTTLILCMMRGMSFDENLKILNLAYKYNLPLDLAGAEGLYKTSEYKELFLLAKEKKIPFTIHAGEADGSESIETAINYGAKRIGHGIRILENSVVIQKAIDNNIIFEVCPTSNVQTNVIDTYQNHPIKKMIEQNLKVTISTDNNTVSNITLSEEYEKLHKFFNFNEEDFKKINLNAIDGAFTKEKKELRRIINENN